MNKKNGSTPNFLSINFSIQSKIRVQIKFHDLVQYTIYIFIFIFKEKLSIGAKLLSNEETDTQIDGTNKQTEKRTNSKTKK